MGRTLRRPASMDVPARARAEAHRTAPPYQEPTMRAKDTHRTMTHPRPGEHSLGFLQPLFERLAARAAGASELPFVTLSYAQSIDGSIAAQPSVPMTLSSDEAFLMTHRLRSRHCALLVGINTVLADDPRLTVRLCDGDNPRPVVLDSLLRIPEHAKLIAHPDRRPLILATPAAPPRKIERLRARGATVEIMPADERGRVALPSALRHLATQGVKALMVEGGATVIDSFLRQRLVDYCVITVAPRLMFGGLKPMGEPCVPAAASLSLTEYGYEPLGRDLIIHGTLAGS
jgi:3,4-dihydroxy 2-butanone 4-phosphate synthase/GTP cyclohydrolase II